MMDQIHIEDLEVHYCVGVPDEERARPQRLLLSVTLYHDFTAAAEADDLNATVDYYALTRRLLKLGEGRSWRLIETLAVDIAGLVLREFHPAAVEVEVKKFILPETRWVSVKVRRLQPGGG
ncbi:MAG: dihydroneopterin aldolase [Verrucomicrobiae bacterium]|nr:dihydroneopterin aldolase [Verrucomicrobiae bacterium]